MIAESLVLFALPALLFAAASWDLASFTIPNLLPAALLILFAAFALAAGLGLPAIGFHLLAGLAGLLVGFVLFALGYIGGGDAKLFAATLLWLGFRDLAPYALVASLFGGALTLGILFVRQLPLPALLARQGWIMRLHDEKAGIPYGVALALGAFWILPQSEIFRLAAA
ncbi:MAG TPA: prepilin peptidase [Rhizomicrobium sp.]|jgi:prepilin peptidase CpaA|nr:prepilin peptidase [Rhizomicrobium sp.]